MENAHQFNTWKQQVENVQLYKQLDCLRIIELNLSNVCNLRCPFCPQSQGFTAEEKFISLGVIIELFNQLKDMQYKGFICIAGLGEPSLNNHFLEIVQLLSEFNVVVVSNGTLHSSKMWEEISKYAQIKISVHDWNNIEYYKDKFKNTNAWFRNHDMNNPQMNLYNRAGYMSTPDQRLNKPCYYPFYKIMIDVNGYYLQCEADWSHKSKSIHNIFNTPIDIYFTEVLENTRKLMDNYPYRQNLVCCQDCDIQGNLTGQKFVDFWRSNVKK